MGLGHPITTFASAAAPPSRRAGASVLIYAMIAMVTLIALGSLAVDYGRVQAVKTDLQRAADATARGALALYQAYDGPTAQANAPSLATASMNPVDAGSGIQPTVTIIWGKWDSITNTFVPGTYNPPAVKVTVSRTAANNNAVQLPLAAMLGQSKCDISASAVARISTTNSGTSYSVSGQADPWLAGMPAGSTASYNDAAPYQSPSIINLPPGASGYLTFTNVSGIIAHGTAAGSSARGDVAGGARTHGIDSPGGPTPAAENGIADVASPLNALLGIFLGASAPNATAAPASRDYSTSASRDANIYSDLQLKQPFYIGDGKTSGGTVQQFRIPPGATRLCLGPMDGFEWKNNSGSYAVTITQVETVSMVK
jgi:Flp pilus assembly protein TadG